MTVTSYSGPRKIVILGGGVAGVAAFDALTSALAACASLPDGMSVTLIEAEDVLGGRAQSWPLDGPSVRHPHAPWGTSTPHGLHFVWGSYVHLARLMGDALSRERLSGGTATYCAWMAAPDLAEDRGARVVAIHVCDPSRPESAWDPRARRLLRAFAAQSAIVGAVERAIETVLGITLSAHEILSYMDVLFDEESLGPELRWSLLFSRAVIAQMGAPETNPLLTRLLGKSPADAEEGELLSALFLRHVLPKMKKAHRLLSPLRVLSLNAWPRPARSRARGATRAEADQDRS